MQEIIIEETDSLQKVAEKTVLLHAGSNALKEEMKKLGVDYTKVVRGLLTFYSLRHKSFGHVKVKL